MGLNDGTLVALRKENFSVCHNTNVKERRRRGGGEDVDT